MQTDVLRASLQILLRGMLLALSFLPALHAQQFVLLRPDCQIFFHFTAAGQTAPTAPNAGLDNRTTGCSTWAVSATSSGFTAFNLRLQSAPNVSGAPGTWVTYLNGTTIAGANPIVGASAGAAGFAWVQGYNPWVRIDLNSVTGSGTVDGAAFGWSIPSASASSAATQNVNVQQYGGVATTQGQKVMASSVPIVIASDQSAVPVTPSGTADVNIKQVNGTTVLTGGVNGSQGVGGLAAAGATPSGNPVPQGLQDSAGNMVIPDYCTSKATFTTSASGSTQLVAVATTTTIRVCHIDFSGDTLTIAKLVTGTGATCTSPADETGVFTGAGGGTFGFAMDYASPLKTTAAKTLCINLSAGSTGGGTIIYSQR